MSFPFAVAAVVAVIHDLVADHRLLLPRQCDFGAVNSTPPWCAAVLTIIGFSINDKIVHL